LPVKFLLVAQFRKAVFEQVAGTCAEAWAFFMMLAQPVSGVV
jgi:hypothetical protein